MDEFDDVFNPSVVCKLNPNSVCPVIVVVTYRSPNIQDKESENLNTLIDTLSEKFMNSKLIIVGDFNFPEINWTLDSCSGGISRPPRKFLNTVQNNRLFQNITEFTHFRVLQNPTLIDLVLTNQEETLSHVVFDPPLGMSHHATIKFHINYEDDIVPDNKSHSVKKFLVSKGNYEGLRQNLKAVDFSFIQTNSVEDSWKNIKKIILDSMHANIPYKNCSLKQGRKQTPVPQSILEKIRIKRRCYKIFKQYRTEDNYKAYAKARNQVRWNSRKLVKLREKELAKDAKLNPKRFFQYVSNRTKPKESVANLKYEGGLTSSDIEKADVLNKFFASVFTTETEEPIPPISHHNVTPTCDVTVTVKQMEKALRELNPAKSPGPDEIHPKVLHEACSELAEPLKLLFDRTLVEGKLPLDWKKAEVKPIFKKGDRSNPGNYRPVSLTSLVCKLFEGFIRDSLCDHLTSHSLLSEAQFGFTKGRSCVTQLLATTKDWIVSLDEGCPVDALYLDFRKAFDTVPHTRLLTKLKSYGIGGNLLNWVTDFLSGRSQFVNINNSTSGQINVTSGVPQGSVIGPTLFIYFINDLPSRVNCPIKIFADDTKIYLNINSDESRNILQKNLDALIEWTNEWLLKFNDDKCHVVHIGKNNPCYQYHIHNKDVTTKLSISIAEKDLGVTIDPLLDFENHINQIVKKANRISGLVTHVIHNRVKEIMVPLFKALVRPIIEYAAPVWSPRLKKHIELLESVQRKFTKKIIGLQDLEYPDRLRDLRLPSLTYRRLRGDLIEVYKIFNNFYDSITTGNLLTSLHVGVTRGHKFKLTKVTTKSSSLQHFFSNRIINHWNSLPIAAVEASTVNTFKNHIDKFFRPIIYSTNIES